MIRTVAIRTLALTLVLVMPAFAQDNTHKMSPQEQAMMEAYAKAGAPGPQHAQLASTAGQYDLVIKSWHAPGTPPETTTGSAERSMTLDGRVMVEKTRSTMMGQAFTGVGMHGYDNVSGKHWSTWNDSMSTGLMVSEGTCDDHGACAFTGSWNDPITKGKITARMTTRWTDKDTQIFEMFGPGPKGEEMKMMEITYNRRDD